LKTRSQAVAAITVSMLATAWGGNDARAQQPGVPATMPPVAPAPQPPPTVPEEQPPRGQQPPPAAAPSEPVPPTPQQVQQRRLTAMIDSTRPSTVVERGVSTKESSGSFLVLPFHSTEATWETVCVTPCQADLDRYSTYRIGKINDVTGSRSFTLPQGTDALRMHVDAGSGTGRRAGEVALGLGIAAASVGAGLIVAQHVFSDETAARNAGFITGGAGIVLLAVGIPLVIATATHVTSEPGGKLALTPHGIVF
jgi:hypothetical protein